MNEFDRQNEWQRSMRDTILKPFYRRFCDEGRFVFIEKSRCSTLLQKRLAVDTVAQSKRGGSICVEEKLVRFPKNGRPLSRFFLETESCTIPGIESPGWMRYADADLLLYGFQTGPDLPSFDCYIIDFQKLKEWFWGRFEAFQEYTMPDTINRTRGRLVPISDVAASVPTMRRWLCGDDLIENTN